MKIRKTDFLWVAMVLFWVTLTACAATKLTSVYKDGGYTGGKIKSVMVVGVAQNHNNRKMHEKYFADQFQANGVKAYTCSALISPGEASNKDRIKNQALKLGVDAVLVTSVAGVDERTEYVPPANTYIPAPEHRSLGSHYARVYGHVNQPGFYATFLRVRLENGLYETRTERLIWSSLSETVDPQSVNEIIKSLCKAVMKSLREQQLIE